MRSSFRWSVLLSMVLLVASCAEPTQPSLAGPSFVISDGANGGNVHFYFLSPMVPSPSPTGVFDGSLEPVVEICVVGVSGCGAPIAIFNTTTGPGSETVRVSALEEKYIVNWHSGDFDLDVSKNYRIRVLVGAQELGFADVDVVNSGGALKNVATGEYIGLVDGRTMPIKFRIEEGALNDPDLNLHSSYLTTCALRTGGAAYCWGYNYYGGVGNGGFSQTSPFGIVTPTPVTGGHAFQAITAGIIHTCGVTTAGDGYCWGYNYYSQLGDGTVSQASPYGKAVPVLVGGGHIWQSLAPGQLHTCGLTTGGDAYCWGYNGEGQVGNGISSYIEPTPKLVSGGHTFASLSSGDRGTCGVTTGGNAYCWGANWYGGLGNGTLSHSSVPVPVSGGHSFQSVKTGLLHSCGLATDGAAWCWGYNRYGSVGNGSFNATYPFGITIPVAVSGGMSFQALSAGGYTSCGLTPTGAALCWGYNAQGQLGTGSSTSFPNYGIPNPAAVATSLTFSAITTGYFGGCGTTTAGDVHCWGWNAYGSVGDGTTINRPTPTALPVFDLSP